MNMNSLTVNQTWLLNTLRPLQVDIKLQPCFINHLSILMLIERKKNEQSKKISNLFLLILWIPMLNATKTWRTCRALGCYYTISKMYHFHWCSFMLHWAAVRTEKIVCACKIIEPLHLRRVSNFQTNCSVAYTEFNWKKTIW